MTGDDPDAALLARVGCGDASAVREIVALKLPRLLSLAQRMLGSRSEAEEVAQETIVRLWKQAADWESGRARVDTWLHRVALNLCYDRLRGRRDEQPYGAEHESADPAPAPDERLLSAQRSERVAAALAALPVRQREALVLQHYQDLSNSEAAALMDISIEALESLLTRARRNLRALLKDEKE